MGVDGWVKLHRKLTDNELWLSEPFSRGQAWVDLILIANHDHGVIRRRGIKVDVSRGQVGFSQESLANRWRWSKNKVRRFLNELQNSGQIELKTALKNIAVSTLITLINYETYQETAPKTELKTKPKTKPKTAPEQEEKEEEEGKELKEERGKKAEEKHAHGEFKNVLLSDLELKVLNEKFNGTLKERVEKLSAYLASTGKKYKSHYATIIKWSLDDGVSSQRKSPETFTEIKDRKMRQAMKDFVEEKTA